MMGNTKKEFKWFTITQYKQEEEYLSSMHRKGWRFTKVIFPGIYSFEECEPENVTYRLDYNQDGIANKAEYVQMFFDCGWEYLFDFVGYSYFRKASEGAEDNEEIFCDDESKFDMMKRVYKGRIIPLNCYFFRYYSSTVYDECGGIWWRKHCSRYIINGTPWFRRFVFMFIWDLYSTIPSV